MSANSISLSFIHPPSFYTNKQISNGFPCYRIMIPASTHPLPLIVEAKSKNRGDDQAARHSRLRKKFEGTLERPRMSVFRSNKHFYVQVIDDTPMHTLAALSTMQISIFQKVKYSVGPTIEVAQKVGVAIARLCLEKGITKVVCDQGRYAYHGRIQAIAEAARANGL